MARSTYAQLGRAELWLRGVGFLIWTFGGVTKLSSMVPADQRAWLIPWALYGLAFVAAAFHAHLPLWSARALLAVQSGAVGLMPTLGFHGLEGLLLAVVVAQLPVVFTLRQSAVLAVAQLLLLLAIVFPFNPTRNILEILGAHSAFSVFALLGYLIQQREREARSCLSEAYAELVSTRAMLVENSRQAERLRISRELHDSLGHHLVALGIQLQLAQKLGTEPGVKAVACAQQISRDALAEVRRVVGSFQSPEAIDLGDALNALASRIPNPHIHIEVKGELKLLNPERAHVLFRCVQEAITNSVKHAEARDVWVSVCATTNPVEVWVTDDGHGARVVLEGNGLAGIRQRMEHLGGSAVFQSRWGHGFSVQLILPAGVAP